MTDVANIKLIKSYKWEQCEAIFLAYKKQQGLRFHKNKNKLMKTSEDRTVEQYTVQLGHLSRRAVGQS